MVMVQDPILFMVLYAGFGASIDPFFFVGFDQYLSNTPSACHLCRDRSTEADRTPLDGKSQITGGCVEKTLLTSHR